MTSFYAIAGDDFVNVVDGLTLVTVAGYAPTVNLEASYEANALLRPITISEVENSSGAYTSNDVIIHLDPSIVPLIGWTISTAYGEFTVISISRETGALRTRVVARLLATNETIIIQRGTFTRTENGFRSLSWALFRGGVDAVLSITGNEPTIEGQARINRDKGIFHAALDGFSLDGEYRILRGLPDRHVPSTSQEIWKVVRVEGRMDLSKLTKIYAERTPWPQA